MNDTNRDSVNGMNDAKSHPTITKQELTSYVEHCKVLVRDIDLVMADRKLRDSGWKIRYAVDFSEIYAYILPEKAREKAPFHDGWGVEEWTKNDDIPLTQFYILGRLFGQGQIILPEPYAVELRSFYERLPARAAVSVARELLHALDAVDKTLRAEPTKNVLRLAAGATDRELTSEEIDYVVNYFEREAAHLVVFARGGELTPIQRLQALLKTRPFVNLREVVSIDEKQIDADAVHQRYDALLSRRQHHGPPASSFLDAMALEHLRLSNEALRKKKTRILLVSRSPHMLDLVAAEGESVWGDGEPIVRHPRIFSSTYDPPIGAATHTQPTLPRRRASLQLFIASASARLNEGSTRVRTTGAVAPRMDDPKDLIEKIRTEWTVSDSLATALTETGEVSAPQTHKAETAAKLLAFLRDRNELFATAQSRVADIVATVTKNHEILAFQLQADKAQYVRGDIRYRFEFRDPAIANVIDRLAEKWYVSVIEATELFRVALESKSNYERLLAMGVSLGALGRWQLTEQTAQRAILEAEAEGVMCNEAHFLMALAIRKQSASRERIVRATAEIDAAMKERARGTLDGDCDPRYLKEKATIEAIWTRKASEPGGAEYVTQYLPSADDIARSFEKAAALTTDEKLRIEILNNLCYLFGTPPTEDPVRARQYLTELEERLTKHSGHRTTWPSFIRDTVIYTNFRLSPIDAPLEAMKNWASELESIPDSDFTPEELKAIISHRSDIREAVLRTTAVQNR